ncbi:MAG: DUF2784 domain-containing protein [Candidatus Latescibacterota bacterium]|nr:MAG: DUF2784 domain-containing protein [Candidatus Latescibacterota bacterium]
MLYRLLADALVVTHFVFILFVLFGGLLVFKWKRFAWIHIPVIIWGVLIEYVGWWCPLTPLENWLRENGGDVPYRVSFIEHYLLPVIYPTALTREVQFVLGSTVLLVNVVIYGLVWRRSLRTGS